MNVSITWRLFWKECRQQRALWIAMVLLTSILMLIVYALSNDARRSLFLLALAFPALYALGCGAMLFAGEHEAGTYGFERSLPVTARHLFLVKVIIAVFSTAALFGLMWPLAAFLSRWRMPDDLALQWATIGFSAVEFLVWAVLFSLLTTRVVMAAILAVAAASTTSFLLAELTNPQAVTLTMAMYLDALPWRATVAAILAIVDFWLGCRWFRDRVPRDRAPAQGTSPVAVATGPADRFFLTTSRTAMLGRLVWQHWRQSWSLIATLTMLWIPLAALVLYEIAIAQWGIHRSYNTVEGTLVPLATFLAIFAAPLFGLCTFHPDQWNRSYRFLSDRGVPPNRVWMSRQVIAWGLPLCLLGSLLVIFFAVGLYEMTRLMAQSRVPLNDLMQPRANGFASFTISALVIIGYVILGISAGQFCAMVLRSGILAGVFSILLTGLCVAWCGLMSLWGINWFWSVAPIPIALLAATRLRASGWLMERNAIRHWLLPALVLVVPTFAIVTSVAFHRAFELPLVDPGFSPDEYDRPMTAEEQATLDLYKQAYKKIVWKTGQPRVDADQQSIALALQAARGTFFLNEKNRSEAGKLHALMALLNASAAKLEKEGKLDAALQQYLAVLRITGQFRRVAMWYYVAPDRTEREVYDHLLEWATRRGQKPDLLISAARQLEALASNASAGEEQIKAGYVRTRKALSGELTEVMGPKDKVPVLTILWLHLPWERTRALRLLNRITRNELSLLSSVEKLAPLQRAIPRPDSYYPWWDRESDYAIRQAIYATPIHYDSRPVEDLVRDYMAMETIRRATRITLALEAWKLEHGSLPKKLDDLAGKYLDHLPVDPYSGQAFRYFPDGLKIPLHWSLPWHIQNIYGGSNASHLTEANRPFIWSAGPKLTIEQPDNQRADKTVVDEFKVHSDIGQPWDVAHKPLSEYDIWQAGWPFAIP